MTERLEFFYVRRQRIDIFERSWAELVKSEQLKVEASAMTIGGVGVAPGLGDIAARVAVFDGVPDVGGAASHDAERPRDRSAVENVRQGSRAREEVPAGSRAKAGTEGDAAGRGRSAEDSSDGKPRRKDTRAGSEESRGGRPIGNDERKRASTRGGADKARDKAARKLKRADTASGTDCELPRKRTKKKRCDASGSASADDVRLPKRRQSAKGAAMPRDEASATSVEQEKRKKKGKEERSEKKKHDKKGKKDKTPSRKKPADESPSGDKDESSDDEPLLKKQKITARLAALKRSYNHMTGEGASLLEIIGKATQTTDPWWWANDPKQVSQLTDALTKLSTESLCKFGQEVMTLDQCSLKKSYSEHELEAIR
jgi:hypothetical protein